ncbi:MAG: glycosyltransferase family 4 protein [Rhodothermia bacterium]|nr:glycosyltransferase family 4 protein [Rhodothermia bacterium]
MTAGRLAYLSAAPRVSTKDHAELGGPRSHVLGTIGGFKREGWEVHAFIVGDMVPDSWVKSGSEQAISVGRVRAMTADLLRLVVRGVSAIKLRRRFREPVDLVYERFAWLQSLGHILQRRGSPWILETNAPLFIESTEERATSVLRNLGRRLELRAYRKCDVLVVISGVLKDIVTSHGVREEKVFVMPNGVDTGLFDPAHYSGRRYSDRFTIGFVGNLAPWQRLDTLLEVVAELKDEDREIGLVFVGDGGEKERLRKHAADLGLADRVVFTGRLDVQGVCEHICGMDVGYSGPEDVRGAGMYMSPLKLYEYMSLKTPVVAAAYADAQSLVAASGSGFMFKPGDRRGLKDAICESMDRRAELAALGEAARATIVKSHSWASRVNDLTDFIRERVAIDG